MARRLVWPAAWSGPPLGLARLLVRKLFVFFDQSKRYGQRDFRRAVERREEVNAFDACSRSVVVVPADQLAWIGVRFMGDTVVNHQHGVFVLHLPHQRLHDLPQVRRSVRPLRQEARDLVMADVRLQEPRKSCGCGRPKRGDQVIGVKR